MYTVLAIDDDKITLGLLEAQLSNLGFSVSTVSSPAKGVEIARSFNPDVILLDLMMPGMDGIGVITLLRRDKMTKDIPVIIISSKHDRENVIDVMRHGVSDYIIKPYDPDRLAAKIKAAVAHRIIRKHEDDENYIEISHRGDLAVIIMKGNPADQGFQADAKKVFNSFFLKQVHGRICVFDLRGIEELTQAGINELLLLLALFAGAKVKIVTGKHYGEIVSMTNIEEKAELFLSFGDLELAMDRR